MKWILFLLLHLIVTFVSGADTIFVRSVDLPGYVQNIDGDGVRILARLKNEIWFYENDEWQKLSSDTKKRYTWTSRENDAKAINIYHTDIIPKEKIADSLKVATFLPGFHTHNTTTASVGQKFYICYRGSVLEYQIYNHINLEYPGISVRNVFLNDSMKVVCTYKGIFYESMNSQPPGKIIQGSYYSSGEFCEFNGKFYLCQDGLFVLQGDSLFVRLAYEQDGGSFRKLLNFNGKAIVMFTNKICEYDLVNQAAVKVYAVNLDFTDIAIFNNELYASTANGILIKISDNGTVKKINIGQPIYDICTDANSVMLACENGLYTYNENGIINVIIEDIHPIQAAAIGQFVYFTTYNGLFLLHENRNYMLVENVEFNKFGLTIFGNYLYAGSTDGLYMFNSADFTNNGLTLFESHEILQNTNSGVIFLFSATLLLLAIGLFLVIRFYKKKNSESHSINEFVKITPELLSEIILHDESILTVQTLAEKLDTSVVQLNRKLKAFDTTPLEVMVAAKKLIALEMHSNGLDLDSIAKRTGYSKRYIQKHFLKASIK